MTNQSYKRQKQSSALPMVASQMSGQNQEQQQQPANHSSNNTEAAGSTLVYRPFSTRRNFPRGATFSFVKRPIRGQWASKDKRKYHSARKIPPSGKQP